MSEIMRFYLLTNKLKYKIRTGWKYWNVESDRLESIAEHIYGTCMLAIAIDSEYNLELDIDYVIKMLVCHELEELVIGDITPFDNISSEEKKEKGKQGVEYVLGNLIKKDEYINLLDEFNERKTNNAEFAYLCDKLECDIQAKIYDNNFNIDITKVNKKILNDNKVNKIINKGYKKAGDIFIEYDRSKYENSEIFTKLLEELKNIDKTSI